MPAVLKSESSCTTLSMPATAALSPIPKEYPVPGSAQCPLNAESHGLLLYVLPGTSYRCLSAKDSPTFALYLQVVVDIPDESEELGGVDPAVFRTGRVDKQRLAVEDLLLRPTLGRWSYARQSFRTTHNQQSRAFFCLLSPWNARPKLRQTPARRRMRGAYTTRIALSMKHIVYPAPFLLVRMVLTEHCCFSDRETKTVRPVGISYDIEAFVMRGFHILVKPRK